MILSLNTADIVESVVFGEYGVADSIAGQALLVDMSSIDAGRTALMSKRLFEQTGAGWVDAPLSGGAPAVSEGKLTLMLGGHSQDVGRATPLLQRLSDNMTHMGASGAGQTVKSIN